MGARGGALAAGARPQRPPPERRRHPQAPDGTEPTDPPGRSLSWLLTACGAGPAEREGRPTPRAAVGSSGSPAGTAAAHAVTRRGGQNKVVGAVPAGPDPTASSTPTKAVAAAANHTPAARGLTP